MKTTLESNTLTLDLEGRIDSTNAQALEAEMFDVVNASPGAEIAFDAQKLEYISSAGLRVLMKLRKQAGKALPVMNVSPEVYDIFDMTGFTQLPDVKKRLLMMTFQAISTRGEDAAGIQARVDRILRARLLPAIDTAQPLEF